MTEQELIDLNSWIAEHVFGWKWWHFKMGDQEWSELVHPLSTWPKTRTQYGGKLADSKPPGIGDCTSAPFYSTDRAASQEVLERCCYKTCPEIQRKIDGSGWVVTARTFGSANIAMAETFPLAICKFAQKLFTKEGK